jgi:hypothetical protein
MIAGRGRVRFGVAERRHDPALMPAPLEMGEGAIAAGNEKARLGLRELKADREHRITRSAHRVEPACGIVGCHVNAPSPRVQPCLQSNFERVSACRTFFDQKSCDHPSFRETELSHQSCRSVTLERMEAAFGP